MGTRQEWGLVVLAVLMFLAGFIDEGGIFLNSSHDWICENPHLTGQLKHETLVCEADAAKEGKTKRLVGSNRLLVGMKMDLNEADERDLQVLPRIGPVLARRIVEYRKRNGFFGALEEIMDVKGIGPKTFLKIERYLAIEKPASSTQ